MDDGPTAWIRVRGARTHNLADVDVDLARGAWTAVVGVSGSGKSSLVFDTLVAESRRRYLATMRRAVPGLDLAPRPPVDAIEGLPPAVATGFERVRPGPRATLGTMTDITRGLETLVARLGTVHCPSCDRALEVASPAAIVDALLAHPAGTRLLLLAPSQGRGEAAIEAARAAGYVRVRRADGRVERIDDIAEVGASESIDIVVDRLVVDATARERFAASVDTAVALGAGRVAVVVLDEAVTAPRSFAAHPRCEACDRSYTAPGPLALSAEHPDGACPVCAGRGRIGSREAEPRRCEACEGTRRAPLARAMRWHGLTLGEIEARPLDALRPWIETASLSGALGALLEPVREDLVARLAFLADVGLGYLALGRAADTLSGGEARRAELASTCAARMSGLLLALDEPTAGLHPDERALLARRLRAVVADGNTLLTVDHDDVLVGAADRVLVIGPGAGALGGRVLLEGPVEDPGGDDAARALLPAPRRDLPLAGPPSPAAPRLRLRGARARTLRGVDVEFPLGHVTVVAGLSGAGKSTLVLDVLAPAVARALAGESLSGLPLDALDGAQHLSRVVVGAGRRDRHPRATAATLLGVSSPLRSLFARTLEARARGWGAAWFGTHAPGGRCETCRGTGSRTLALPDAPAVRVTCDVCGGRRMRPDAEAARWRGFSFADLLERPLAEIAAAFRDVPAVGAPLHAANEVGLGYVRLGEFTTALSSGEALRLRLAAALGRAALTPTLFVLDEPCLGLHPRDVGVLLGAFTRLAAAGHTVVAVEHHVEAIAAAAHVVELGPGPGDAGGRVVFAGAPRDLARADTSTGRLLRV